MKIIEMKDRTSQLIQQLVNVWETSVRATHLFLSDAEIENIKQYVPQALQEIPQLIVGIDEAEEPIAFMGIDHQKLEMLFVRDSERGKGFGKMLMQYGMEKYSISTLTVNEQNPLAKRFYEKMGFSVYKRTEWDEQGNPYPILYMKKEGENAITNQSNFIEICSERIN